MGPYRAKALALLFALCAGPAVAQSEGWHYSHLPGEGDRASIGCASGSTSQTYTCIAVRCEDDFTVGLHLHTSRAGGAAGRWGLTVDRERASIETEGPSLYGAKIADPDNWLLERIEQGTFIYIQHADDEGGDFAHISLAGSYRAIREALYFCAPRTGADEQKDSLIVSDQDLQEN